MPGRQFWPDDLSLTDPRHFPTLPSSRHLTEALQDGLEIEGLRVQNSFSPGVDPEDLR
ncbi:MAG: hypothetical protein KGS60_18145 [Verrucomicrobia bacterium]|nr:hypothetical protein [Verrucomicrobiota bacterium]